MKKSPADPGKRVAKERGCRARYKKKFKKGESLAAGVGKSGSYPKRDEKEKEKCSTRDRP